MFLPVPDASEGAWIEERELRPGRRMRNGENGCVQQKSWAGLKQIQRCIEVISQNRVTDAQHVDPQLM